MTEVIELLRDVPGLGDAGEVIDLPPAQAMSLIETGEAECTDKAPDFPDPSTF